MIKTVCGRRFGYGANKKRRYPKGQYSKLNPRKLGPFPNQKKINDNAYVIDLPPNIHTALTFKVADTYSYHAPDVTAKEIIDLRTSSSQAASL